MNIFICDRYLGFLFLLPLFMISCEKEDSCSLITKDVCQETSNSPEFLFTKCTTVPDIQYLQSYGKQFLFTSHFPVNLPADYTLVDIEKKQIITQFGIPGNTLLRYWSGDYFYYMSVPNEQNNVSLIRYDLKNKTSKVLIQTPYILTTQILGDKMFVFELYDGNVSFPNFQYIKDLYEIDFKTGNVDKISQPTSKENAKHIYVEYRNDERIFVTVLEDRRYEFNDTKKIEIGEFPTNLLTKIIRFVDSYGQVFHYHTDKGAYLYHNEYKTSLPPDPNIGFIDNEYYILNNRIHRWKDMKEIENYKGPIITPFNRGRYYFYNDIICYTDDKTVHLHRFSEEKPYKSFTYCSSLNDYYGITVLNDEIYLQNSKNMQILKIKI